jgi:hypothetical protein
MKKLLLTFQVFVELLRIGWTFRRRQWYRHFPFLPFPPKEYLEWRLETAYGEKRFRNVRWHDVVAYALWHRGMRRTDSARIVKDDIWE